MIDLHQWVEENCTELEKVAFRESCERQDAIFYKLLEQGKVEQHPITHMWINLDPSNDHVDDPMWLDFERRYLEATGQKKG